MTEKKQSNQSSDDCTDNLIETSLQNSELFSDARKWGATASGIVITIIIVFFGWLLETNDSTSTKSFIDSMREMGPVASGSGWGIIGVAVSLVAVAVTAATIVGLRDPDDESWRRRYLVMSMADTFIVASVALLSGCAFAAFCGYFGANGNFGKDNPAENDFAILLVFGASAILWICVQQAYSNLREIALSDQDALLTEKTSINEKLSDYKESTSLLTESLRKVKFAPREYSLSKAILSAFIMSILMAILLGLLLAVLSFIPSSTNGNSTHNGSRYWPAVSGVSILALISMALTIPPWLWAYQIWKTNKKGVRRGPATVGALVMSSPVWMIVPLIMLDLTIDPDIEGPIWKRIILSIGVIVPSVLMLAMKRKWSWRVVSILSAYKKLQDLEVPLKARLLELENKENLTHIRNQNKSSETKLLLELQSLVDDKLTDIHGSLKAIISESNNDHMHLNDRGDDSIPPKNRKFLSFFSHGTSMKSDSATQHK